MRHIQIHKHILGKFWKDLVYGDFISNYFANVTQAVKRLDSSKQCLAKFYLEVAGEGLSTDLAACVTCAVRRIPLLV